jgi:hypothetical protein
MIPTYRSVQQVVVLHMLYHDMLVLICTPELYPVVAICDMHGHLLLQSASFLYRGFQGTPGLLVSTPWEPGQADSCSKAGLAKPPALRLGTASCPSLYESDPCMMQVQPPLSWFCIQMMCMTFAADVVLVM